jgi:hypothetical protein
MSDFRLLPSSAWCACLLVSSISTTAVAGPPFLTDDPDTVPCGHYETYLFVTYDRGPGSTAWALPAFEFNLGASPNLQLHVVVPAAYLVPQGAYGLGDVELGAKYRLVREGASVPEVAVFPLVEVPTGDRARGLGNGRTWMRLPVWVQKSGGPWTTYGGIGYEVNQAEGMKNSLFAGWLLQRQISRRLILGTEVYSQQARAVEGHESTSVDAGGYYNVREDVSVLFMLGHTIAGEEHTVAYVGLYYTWGRPSVQPVAGAGLSALAGRTRSTPRGSW